MATTTQCSTTTRPGTRPSSRCSVRVEADLVLAAQAGDVASFEELYRRYSRRIHGFAVTLVHDSHEAADVTQATFVTASQRIGQLRTPEGFRSWLFSIARHDAYRRRQRRQRTDLVAEVEGPLTDSTEATATATLHRLDVAGVIEDAADALVGRDRCVIAHRLRDEVDGPDLADELGISRDHAYTLVHRAGTRLKAAIEGVVIARDPGHCDSLSSLLEGWAGRYTPQVHRRVRHHMAHCECCQEASATRSADLQG